MNRRKVRELEVLGRFGLHKQELASAQISNFSVGEWTIESGAGTITDTGNELKISPNAGSSLNVIKTVSLNLVKRSLQITWKADVVTDLLLGRLYLTDSNGISEYFESAFAAGWNTGTTEYHRISLHHGDLSGGGLTLNLSNIVQIKFTIQAKAAVTPSVWVKKLSWVDNNYPGKIHWSMDDGHIAVKTNLLSRLADRSMPLACFVNLNVIDTADHLTLDDLIEMNATGQATIGGHGQSHEDFSVATSQNIIQGMRRPKLYFEQHGIVCDYFQFPYHRSTVESMTEAYKNYNAVWSWLGKISTAYPTKDGYSRVLIGPDTIASDITPKIDAIKTHGGLLCLYGHNPTPTDLVQGMNLTELDAILAYISAQGIECLSCDGVYRIAGPVNTHQVPGCGGVTTKTVNGTLDASESGLIICSNVTTMTLPSNADLGDCFYTVLNDGPSFMTLIVGDGSHTIEEKNGIYIYPGTYQTVVFDRVSNWRVTGGLRDLIMHDISYRKRQVIFTAWTASHTGSGVGSSVSDYINARTGTTANSRGMFYSTLFGFGNSISTGGIAYGKKLAVRFLYGRLNSDTECIARVQLKGVSTEGVLAAKGIDLIRAENLDLHGGSFGTALGSVNLGTTLTTDVPVAVMVIFYPGLKIEWYVNGVLKGTETDTTKIPTFTGGSIMVNSITNGATGGIDCYSMLEAMMFTQELF